MKEKSILIKIIFSGLILSSLLSGCSKNSTDDTKTMSSESSAESSTEISGEDKNEPNSQSEENTEASLININEEKPQVVNPIKVNMKLSNGDIRKTDYDSLSEINLNRPSFIGYNEVFTGWNENDTVASIGEHSINTEEGISLSLNTVDISKSDNTLFNDSIYTECGDEYISVPIKIGGNTNFSVFELEIKYDSKVLEFESFENTDVDATCNCSEKGTINICFVSTENIQSEVYICDIKFRNIKHNAADTQLEYKVSEMAAWNDDFTGYVDVKHNIVNGKIVMY